MSASFQTAYALGRKYEQVLLRTLNFNNISSYKVASGYFKDWDVFVQTKDGRTITFESKADTYAQRTNELAIEFRYRNEPSGIESTKATIWAHWVVGTRRYYLIPTRVLRRLIEEGKYTSIKRGGDGSMSAMYIVECETVKEYERDLGDDVECILERSIPCPA